jgi:hypothetical protein
MNGKIVSVSFLFKGISAAVFAGPLDSLSV